MRTLAILFLLFVSSYAPALAQNVTLPATQEEIVSMLPPPWFWQDHLRNDLIRFWDMPAALGDPQGAFPTTRCDDGSLVDYAKPCPEVAQSGWLMNDRSRALVALSRQTYAYGVAFHMTGDRKYLGYMKKGVDYIRANAFDRAKGGMYTRQETNGRWGPDVTLRNPQELGYGLLGISFYYYLTRDPAVLADIFAAKDHIFRNYYDPAGNYLRWQLADGNGAQAREKRLVAQLDQMNAYMVLVTPILPEPKRSEWLQDLDRLSRIMIGQFYNKDINLFFLSANTAADLDLGRNGTDFGHTIKAMWMIRMTGLMSGQSDLVEFAETNGPRVLEFAFNAQEPGSWDGGVLPGGARDRDKSWWVYCELDQFAGSMAMTDWHQARWLGYTVPYWWWMFVDHQYGEVWTTLSGATHGPTGGLPKQWPWKNGYHSFEHALVGYISTSQLYGMPVTLHYAFDQLPPAEEIRPYFHTAETAAPVFTGTAEAPQWKVEFSGVK
jgi:mannose/cellobiose epimerase-like protein (N-acyl-D-glucosamine 2-epimerase family)